MSNALVNASVRLMNTFGGVLHAPTTLVALMNIHAYPEKWPEYVPKDQHDLVRGKGEALEALFQRIERGTPPETIDAEVKAWLKGQYDSLTVSLPFRQDFSQAILATANRLLHSTPSIIGSSTGSLLGDIAAVEQGQVFFACGESGPGEIAVEVAMVTGGTTRLFSDHLWAGIEQHAPERETGIAAYRQGLEKLKGSALGKSVL